MATYSYHYLIKYCCNLSFYEYHSITQLEFLSIIASMLWIILLYPGLVRYISSEKLHKIYCDNAFKLKRHDILEKAFYTVDHELYKRGEMDHDNY